MLEFMIDSVWIYKSGSCHINGFQVMQLDDIVKEISTNREGSGHQWLTPVILATQEAEVRRIAI
jgi:hypothetical protein